MRVTGPIDARQSSVVDRSVIADVSTVKSNRVNDDIRALWMPGVEALLEQEGSQQFSISHARAAAAPAAFRSMRDPDAEICSSRYQIGTKSEENSRHPSFPGRDLSTDASLAAR
jgi:hypothetical protein